MDARCDANHRDESNSEPSKCSGRGLLHFYHIAVNVYHGCR